MPDVIMLLVCTMFKPYAVLTTVFIIIGNMVTYYISMYTVRWYLTMNSPSLHNKITLQTTTKSPATLGLTLFVNIIKIIEGAQL